MYFANCNIFSEFIILHFGSIDMPRLCAINHANFRIMNSDNILLLAKSIESLSFLINSASCKIKVEFYIVIRF